MSPQFLRACELFQPAEKACWEILLREHGAGALPPAVLDGAIEQSLRQLWRLVRTGRVDEMLKVPPSLSGARPAATGCALETFLPYFASGRRALDLIAQEVAKSQTTMSTREIRRARKDLANAFEVLVQTQLETLCSGCPRTGICRYGGRGGLDDRTDVGKPLLPSKAKLKRAARGRPGRREGTARG